VEGEYQMIPFTEDIAIVSPTFPQFKLSAQQVFALAG
jgi:Uma2 family endonuclease